MPVRSNSSDQDSIPSAATAPNEIAGQASQAIHCAGWPTLSPQNLISRKHATVRGAAAWPIDVAAHIAWLGSTQALKIHTLMATCYF